MARRKPNSTTGGEVGGDARGDTAAPAVSPAGVPLPLASPPISDRLIRLHTRGLSDGHAFLADRGPLGHTERTAWLLGVAGVFARQLLPMLQEKQRPLRVTVALRLPWRARLRLLRTGRLKVDLAVPVEAPTAPAFGQPLLALESAGRSLQVELAEAPEAQPGPAEGAAATPHRALGVERDGLWWSARCACGEAFYGATARRAWRKRDEHLLAQGALGRADGHADGAGGAE